MNIKEKIENNLVIFFIGVMITGFISGVSAYKLILDILKSEVVSKKENINLLKKQNELNYMLNEYKNKAKNYENEIKILKNEMDQHEKKYISDTQNLLNENKILLAKIEKKKVKEQGQCIIEKKLIEKQYQTKIQTLKKKLDQKEINSNNLKVLDERKHDLEQLEEKLLNEQKKLENEKKILSNQKLAQDYLDRYLSFYSHVDVSLEKSKTNKKLHKEYQKAMALLNILESIAIKINNDNIYLDFVNKQKKYEVEYELKSRVSGDEKLRVRGPEDF